MNAKITVDRVRISRPMARHGKNETATLFADSLFHLQHFAEKMQREGWSVRKIYETGIKAEPFGLQIYRKGN